MGGRGPPAISFPLCWLASLALHPPLLDQHTQVTALLLMITDVEVLAARHTQVSTAFFSAQTKACFVAPTEPGVKPEKYDPTLSHHLEIRVREHSTHSRLSPHREITVREHSTHSRRSHHREITVREHSTDSRRSHHREITVNEHSTHSRWSGHRKSQYVNTQQTVDCLITVHEHSTDSRLSSQGNHST